MTRSKVRVMEVWNMRKWPISKSISSTNMHIIKRLTVNYDTPRQYLSFIQTNFWYSSCFGVTLRQKVFVGKRIFPLMTGRPAVLYVAYFITVSVLHKVGTDAKRHKLATWELDWQPDVVGAVQRGMGANVTSLVPNIVVIDGTSPVTTELNVRHLAENVGPVQVSTILPSLFVTVCYSHFPSWCLSFEENGRWFTAHIITGKSIQVLRMICDAVWWWTVNWISNFKAQQYKAICGALWWITRSVREWLHDKQ